MEDFIPTRVSEIKKDAVKEFLSVTYEEPKKKVKRNVPESEKKFGTSNYNVEECKETKDDQKRKQEREMKRIRYEVMKFGMSGFEKDKATEAKVALAISLGAKPPKNKGVNYKLLKLQKEKQKEMKKNETESGLEKSMIKYKSKANNKTKHTSLLGVYGKVNKKSLKKGKK
ncbi:uncharacterized protein LOC143178419 [Calliopsis andreniformis]|uniref:uncharacterized protein LOC143178419 n=1 Tax=Calliopsis andreniformis TaxID=337506 RepID=UPI003FCCC1D3